MSFLSPLKVKSLSQRSESKQENSHFSKKEKVLGQFFTPREVVDFVLDFISVTNNKKDKAIDPACGDGVFLKGLIARKFKEVKS